MKYSDEIIDFVIDEWDKEQHRPEMPDFLKTAYERIAWHVNRYFHRGRKRFFASDTRKIIEKHFHKLH